MIKTLSAVAVAAIVSIGALSAHAYDTLEAKRAWLAVAKLEQKHGIPKGLLHSMSLVETGKGLDGKVMPWPYTVGLNSPGSKTFTDAKAALSKLDYYTSIGFDRFDVTVNGDTQTKLSQYRAERLIARASGEIKLTPRHTGKRFADRQEAASFVKQALAKGYVNMDIGLMQINWRYHGENFLSVEHALDPYQNAAYAVQYLTKHKETRDWWGSVGRYHSGTPQHAERYVKNVWRMYQRLHQIDTSRIG